jgi:hypothetical protein
MAYPRLRPPPPFRPARRIAWVPPHLDLPKVVTEAASAITDKGATFNGMVTPEGGVTKYWFEYGPTEAYGSSTGAGTIDEPGKVAVLVSGLKPNTTYHFRLRAENGEGVVSGGHLTFKTAQAQVKRRRRRKPSLALDIEVETADGTIFRLPTDSRKASKRPRGLTFSTQRGDGFGPGGAQLSRAIFRDYPDIGLLDTWRMVSKSGDIRYEGRLHSNPRTTDPEEQIDLNLVGWMTYLKGRKINPIVIDRRTAAWEEPSKDQVAAWLTAGNKVFASVVHIDENAVPVVRLVVQEPWPAGGRCGALYRAPSSEIGELRFSRKKAAGDNFLWRTYLLSADNFSSIVASANGELNAAKTNATIKAASAKYAWVELDTGAGAEAGTSETSDTFFDLRVIGSHGLTPRGAQPNEGFYITDVMQWILSTYYPKIAWAGEENTFPITQAAYGDDPQYGYDLMQQFNDLILWETNVWEGRQFHFHAADLTRYDWQISTDEEGVTALFEGDSIENFANGVEVIFTDFMGQRRVLYPTDHADLRDDSEENPANRHGEELWIDVDYPYPCTEEEALQFGRAYLAEFNRPKRPGTYAVQGHILDGDGYWQPGNAVRNSETLGVTNHPSDRPRLITGTSWDDDSKTLRITVDAPDKLLDAVIARHELARQARNLG